MILHWPIWLKPVTMTAKDIKMKVLAENLTVKTKYADEQGCSVQAAEYVNGGLAIQLHTADGERMLTASVFIEGRSEKLLPFQFYSKDWNENEGVVEWLKKAEIVTGTGYYVKTGFCEAELLELSPKYRKIIDTVMAQGKGEKE